MLLCGPILHLTKFKTGLKYFCDEVSLSKMILNSIFDPYSSLTFKKKKCHLLVCCHSEDSSVCLFFIKKNLRNTKKLQSRRISKYIFISKTFAKLVWLGAAIWTNGSIVKLFRPKAPQFSSNFFSKFSVHSKVYKM